MKTLRFLTNQYFLLAVIIIIGFWARLYKIDNPIADWHSWRQADTAAVARNFYKLGFNPFIPIYDDMSGVAQNPVPNPHRYRFVEFPLYNAFVYFAYLINGGVDERLARLLSAVISLGSIVFIFLLVRKYWGEFTAIVAALLFAILPFNVYFSRTVLPEPSLVCMSLGMLYFTDRWIFENKKWLFIVSLVIAMTAFLVKPMAVFYALPLFYSYRVKEGKWWPIPKRYIFFTVIAIIPLFAWRAWMMKFPEGIPASTWLLNGDGIRFRPAFWKWIINERLGVEILSVEGTVLFFIGALTKPRPKEGALLHWLLFSSFLFVAVFATGNVRHNYYQTLIIPALAIFLARGFVLMLKGIPNFLPRIWTIPIALIFLPIGLYLSWTDVRGFYQINNPPIIEAGKMANQILPKDAVVIAPYDGDTAFLYQTNRPGWPYAAFPIKDLHDMFGVNYYISVSLDAKTKWVMRKYQTIIQTPSYVIVDLTKERPGFDSIHDIEPM